MFTHGLEGTYESLELTRADGNWPERWDILMKNNLYWNKIAKVGGMAQLASVILHI